MNAEQLVFILFALIIVGGAMFLINSTKIVHMVVASLVVFIGIAAIFVYLHAEFIAFVQILIYTGAIAAVIIFGIMMTDHQKESNARPKYELVVGASALLLFAILFYSITQTAFPLVEQVRGAIDPAFEIGKLLFNHYVVAFELMGILLTVAFIGSIAIAKRSEDDQP